MNETSGLAASKIEIVLCTALLGVLMGCTTYVDQPRSHVGYYEEQPRLHEAYMPPPPVYLPPPAVQVEASFGSAGVAIHSENDFDEPLSEYGRWEVVGSHGRCWIPNRVGRDWRPYSNGNWERTDAGWYWASDEPWAWATYHYGRWDLSPQLGWYWVPRTQWAPAWVSWHEGGGYVGWAPLQPSARISAGGSVALNVALIAPRAFVFVEPRHFLQPIRPATVVVNNTTLINKTVNITNIKVVNNTVINEGPRTQIIEQASGREIQALPVRELRRKQEAAVVAHQRVTPVARQEKVSAPVRSDVNPRETEALLESQRRAKEAKGLAQDESRESIRTLDNRMQLESQRRANEAAAQAQNTTLKRASGLEMQARQQPQLRANDSERKAQADAQRNARGREKNTQRLSEQETPGTSEKGAMKLLKKDRKKEGRDRQTPPEKPGVVPLPSSR